MMDYNKIGSAIKKLRLEAGYTQHKLAECLDVTDKAVSKWERGLSVPDISIIMKLANLLNCDVDNLLEGNISYLVKNWQGLLILDESNKVFCGTEVYGKPVVHFLLSYFVLAGIRDIHILCPEKEQQYIQSSMGEGGQYGIQLVFIRSLDELQPANTMVVKDLVFVYGPNLTRYFQRAMSRNNGVSVITQESMAGSYEQTVYYDNDRRITDKKNRNAQRCLPVFFFPEKCFEEIRFLNDLQGLGHLYAEPMDNGMIAYNLEDEDSLLDTAVLMRFLKKKMGKDIYNLSEVARNRLFIK